MRENARSNFEMPRRELWRACGDAVLGVGCSRALGVAANLGVALQSFFADVASAVVEVDDGRLVANVFASHAAVDEPHAKLAIFSSPLHALIEATDCDKVFAPAARVVPVPVAL